MKKQIMPPTYFYLGIALIILMHFIFPIRKIIFYPYTLIGLLLIILGTMLNISAWLLFVKHKTTQNPFKNPNKFIINGIYKISRNPMYLGMLIILFGLAIFLGSLVSFIFPLLFFIIMEKFYMPLEEKNMEKLFGKKYLDYKEKVRRWI